MSHATRSKRDMQQTQQAGKEQLVLLKPKAHNFYTTYLLHQPCVIENNPYFRILSKPKF